MANKKNKRKNSHTGEKEAKAEKLTNWYMINLSFGVLAIIVLLILRKLYRTPSVLIYMQSVAWVLTGLFALGAIVLFTLGKTKVIKNCARARNYSIFLGVCALGSLWLALYNRLRIPLEKVVRIITRNPSQTVSSYWNIYLLIIGVVAYLVIAFVIYLIKLRKYK